MGGGGRIDKTWDFNQWFALDIPRLNGTTLPISVFCANYFEIRDLKSVSPWFRIMSSLDTQAQVDRLGSIAEYNSCKQILNRPWKWWAVINGRGNVRFVSNKWSLIKPFIDGYNTALCRKADSFLEALKLALLDGESIEQFDLRNADYRTFMASQPTTSQDQPTGPSTPHPSRSSTPSSTPPPVYTPVTSTTTPYTNIYPTIPTHDGNDPATPSRAHQTYMRRTTSNHVNTTLPRAPSPAACTADTHSVSSPPQSETSDDNESSEGSIVEPIGQVHRDASVRGFPMRNADTHGSSSGGGGASVAGGDNSQFIYGRQAFLHQRDFHSNLQGLLYDSPPPSVNLVPSFGSYIDEWADSHGYEDAFLVGLYSAFVSSNTSADFVEAVSEMLSIQEARWVYRWARWSEGNGYRRRNFDRAVKMHVTLLAMGDLVCSILGLDGTSMPSSNLVRYPSDARKLRKTMARMPWRTRTRQKKSHAAPHTPAEKKAAAEATKQRKTELSSLVSDALLDMWKIAERLHKDQGKHSVQYWYEFLLQRAGKQKKKRRTSSWNAFVSKSVKAHNDALPIGEPRVKASVLMQDLRERWRDMSELERAEFTEDAKEHLEERREMKQIAVHNVPINEFHDLEYLCNRTSTEIMIIGSRAQSSSYLVPFTLLKFKMSPAQYAAQLECFLLSGIEGAVQKCENELAKLKKKTADLIIEKLQFVGRPDQISRMYYRDFEMHITHKFGIVVENWPLKDFVCPSHVSSRIELDTLYHGWESGATHFRRLSPAELTEWRRQRVEKARQAQAQNTSPVAAVTEASTSTALIDEPGSSEPSAPEPSSSSTPLPGPAATISQPLSSDVSSLAGTKRPFETAVFSVGSSQLVQKKKRKERSDKGKKYGPRKKAVALAPAAKNA
ncbi:hypothetical protein BDY19DRAFT_910751 [Irpex rosettiformis]|uniref:Uncharacterized protein n=1 Tax=Irpex rosettiformis TaxID=378272 RepID=A0ACB8TMR6_9APHY|nr:hypothetical protein BDY19DRAFT_910751 [Irpex rosettiformis]